MILGWSYSGYTCLWLQVDQSLDIYGTNYGLRESINGPHHGYPGSTIKWKLDFLSLWNLFVLIWGIFGVAIWNSSPILKLTCDSFASSNVCLYSKHILANSVFATVFPTIVDPFKPSLCFFPHIFSCFCHWSSFLLNYSNPWESFFLHFFLENFGTYWSFIFSSWVLLGKTSQLKNWELRS